MRAHAAGLGARRGVVRFARAVDRRRDRRRPVARGRRGAARLHRPARPWRRRRRHHGRRGRHRARHAPACGPRHHGDAGHHGHRRPARTGARPGLGETGDGRTASGRGPAAGRAPRRPLHQQRQAGRATRLRPAGQHRGVARFACDRADPRPHAGARIGGPSGVHPRVERHGHRRAVRAQPGHLRRRRRRADGGREGLHAPVQRDERHAPPRARHGRRRAGPCDAR